MTDLMDLMELMDILGYHLLISLMDNFLELLLNKVLVQPLHQLGLWVQPVLQLFLH